MYPLYWIASFLSIQADDKEGPRAAKMHLPFKIIIIKGLSDNIIDIKESGDPMLRLMRTEPSGFLAFCHLSDPDPVRGYPTKIDF